LRRRSVRFGRAVGQTRHPIGLVQADPFGDGGGEPAGIQRRGPVPSPVLDDKFNEFEAHC